MATDTDLDELMESGATDLDALAGVPASRTSPSAYTDLDSLTDAEESVGTSQVQRDAEARRRGEIDAHARRKREGAFPATLSRWLKGEATGGLGGLVTGETKPTTFGDVLRSALPAPSKATLDVRELTPGDVLGAGPIGASRPRYGMDTEEERPARKSDPVTELGRQLGLASFSNLGRILRGARSMVRPSVPERPAPIDLQDVTGSLARMEQKAPPALTEAAPSITETARAFREAQAEGQTLAEQITRLEDAGLPVPKAMRREYEALKGRMAQPVPEAPRPPVPAEPPTPPTPRGIEPPVSGPGHVTELGVTEAPSEGRWTALRRFLFGGEKSPEYTIWSRSRRGELASRAEDVAELGKEMQAATKAEAARLGVSTQEAGGRMGLALKGATQDLGPEAQAIVPKVRAQIDANSTALAERGIIGEVAEEVGRGQYTRRVYQRDIMGGDTWAGMVPADVREEATRYILANNLVKVGKGQYRPPTPEEAAAIADGIARGRITQANFAGRSISMPVGQTMRRKDIPEPIRRLMGEVEEGTYLAARTLADQNRLILNHDFLDAFSTMGEVINGKHVPWVSKTPALGYRAVPVNRLVKQAMGAGARDEVYVLARYANDFARQFGPQSIDLFDKLYNPLYSAFKMSKTVLNPATHLRNITGDVLFSDLADTFALDPRNWRFYRDAAKAILTKNSLWKEGLQYGVIGTEYGTAELGLVAREFALADSPVQAMTRMALNPVKKLSALYNAEDQVFKLASYIKQVAQGKLPWEASAWTNKWYPNYADVPEVIQLLRQGKGSLIGSPFVSFASEAARIGATAAKEQPLTLAKWLLGVPAATVASAAYVGADLDELRSAYRKLPKHMRSPFTMLLPWRDAKGHLQVTDQRYSHPLGQILGGLVGEQDSRGRLFNLPFLSEFLAGNPLVTLAWELGTNTNLSPFASGEPLVRPSDQPIGKRLEHSLRALGPSLLPNVPGVTERGGPAYEQIKKNVQGKPGRYGQKPTPFGALVGELTPLRVTPIDPALARSTHGARKWELRQLDEEEGRLKREARRGLLTRDQMRERMTRLQEKRKELMAP